MDARSSNATFISTRRRHRGGYSGSAPLGLDGNIYAATDLGGWGALALSPAGQLLWSNTGDPVMVVQLGTTGWKMSFVISDPRELLTNFTGLRRIPESANAITCMPSV